MAVDSSQPALEEAHVNSARNNLEGIIEFVKDDALKYMKVSAVAVLSAIAYSTNMAYAMVVSVYLGPNCIVLDSRAAVGCQTKVLGDIYEYSAARVLFSNFTMTELAHQNTPCAKRASTYRRTAANGTLGDGLKFLAHEADGLS